MRLTCCIYQKIEKSFLFPTFWHESQMPHRVGLGLGQIPHCTELNVGQMADWYMTGNRSFYKLSSDPQAPVTKHSRTSNFIGSCWHEVLFHEMPVAGHGKVSPVFFVDAKRQIWLTSDYMLRKVLRFSQAACQTKQRVFQACSSDRPTSLTLGLNKEHVDTRYSYQIHTIFTHDIHWIEDSMTVNSTPTIWNLIRANISLLATEDI